MLSRDLYILAILEWILTVRHITFNGHWSVDNLQHSKIGWVDNQGLLQKYLKSFIFLDKFQN